MMKMDDMVGFNAYKGLWKDNAQMALDTINMRGARGIPVRRRDGLRKNLRHENKGRKTLDDNSGRFSYDDAAVRETAQNKKPDELAR